MPLTYKLKSPQDMLAKAERDLSRLKKAEAAQNNNAMSDSLFDLAVALTSLKDWLKEHPGATFSPKQVEKYVADSIALSTFRDIANGGKHRFIRKYEPETMGVTGSNATSVLVANNATETPKPFYRIKIIRADGSRHRAIELGRDAVHEWRAFMKSHELMS